MSHTEIVSILDCGCVIKEGGDRVWCPSCLDDRGTKIVGQSLSLRGAQAWITQWANHVFPDRTVKGSLAKLMCEELPELIGSKMRDRLEYADVLIMVLDLAGQMQIDIEQALRDKMAVNLTRKWQRDPESGFYSHIKEEMRNEGQV